MATNISWHLSTIDFSDGRTTLKSGDATPGAIQRDSLTIAVCCYLANNISWGEDSY